MGSACLSICLSVSTPFPTLFLSYCLAVILSGFPSVGQSLTEGEGEIRASVNAVRGPFLNYLKLNCDHFIYLNYDHFSPREDDLNLHPESSSTYPMRTRRLETTR